MIAKITPKSLNMIAKITPKSLKKKLKKREQHRVLSQA
jgi:hypothetical protein